LSYVGALFTQESLKLFNGSKSTLMQLASKSGHSAGLLRLLGHGELFGGISLRHVDSHVDWDSLTELVSLGTSEGEEKFVNFIASDGVVEHSQGDLDLGLTLALQLLIDWELEDLDWDLGLSLLVVKSEHAACLPWPVGVIEDLDLDDDTFTWNSINHVLRLLEDNGSLELVFASFFATVSGHALLNFGWVSAHLGDEVLDHVLEDSASATSATAATTTTTEASACTCTAFGERVDQVLKVVGTLWFLFLSIEDGDQDIRGSTSLFDLQEGVFVAEALLTGRTVIEVLAN
jgi:hypothetical protein